MKHPMHHEDNVNVLAVAQQQEQQQSNVVAIVTTARYTESHCPS